MGAPAGSFGGELGTISLFDLGQLLLLNRATGCLAVTHDGRRGYLFFQDGQIINALDDDRREGEEAAYAVFGWREGRFEFRPEPPGGARLIHDSATGIMLEAARRLDESDGAAAGTIDRLRERQGAMEALREVFHQVTRDARVTAVAQRISAGALLDALVGAGDALLFRPGAAPRFLSGGRWSEATTAPLAAAEYAELRAWLLEDAEEGDRHTHVVNRAGREFSVTVLGAGTAESLWMRPARLAPPAPDTLEGPRDALHAVLNHGGVVLAGGPSVESARRLLHALAALAARRRGGTVALVTDDPTYRAPEGGDVVLHVSPAEAQVVLDALAPDALALDVTARGVSGVAPLVIAMVVAGDVATLPARWLASLPATAHAQAETLHEAGPVGLVLAEPVTADDRIAFIAQTTTTAPRATVLAPREARDSAGPASLPRG